MDRSVPAMSPSNGICTLTNTKSLFFNMAFSSSALMLVYAPPSMLTFCPGTSTGLPWHAARVKASKKISKRFMIFSCLTDSQLFQLLYQAAHISQAARSLGISQITCTLVCLYTCVNVVGYHDAAFWRDGPKFTDSVPEAVADKYFIFVWSFLINTFPNLFDGECSFAIGRIINRRAVLRATKQIFH